MKILLTILPVELIEEIINIVALIDAPDHHPNIKACSLTCHAFLPHARKHIFRSITVYEGHRTSSVSSNTSRPLLLPFARLITHNPKIGEYVRELRYFIIPALGRIEAEGPGPSSLGYLTNLEVFSIQGENFLISWKTMYSPSRSALLHLMHKPTISSVSMSRISGFSLPDLVPCTHLRTLRLRDVTFCDERDATAYDANADADAGALESLQPSYPIRVRELNVDVTTASYLNKRLEENQGLPFDLRDIQSLTLLVRSDFRTTIDPAVQFFERLGRLTSLHFTGFDIPAGSCFQLAIPFLPTLRELRFDSSLPSFHENMFAIPRHLQKLIQAGENRIETIQIRFQIADTCTTSGLQPLAQSLQGSPTPTPNRSTGWALFEELILQVANWPCLKHFEMAFHVRIRYPLNLFRMARRSLPRLYALSASGSSIFRYLEVMGDMPVV